LERRCTQSHAGFVLDHKVFLGYPANVDLQHRGKFEYGGLRREILHCLLRSERRWMYSHISIALGHKVVLGHLASIVVQHLCTFD